VRIRQWRERARAGGVEAEQDDDVQACVCGCETGGTLWNGLRELERGVRECGNAQAHVCGSVGEAVGDSAGVTMAAVIQGREPNHQAGADASKHGEEAVASSGAPPSMEHARRRPTN
jgi:hypothetical protein